MLREQLGPEGAEWVYYGATVQDVTDTWFGLVMQRMLAILRRDLGATQAALLALAAEHRDTVMLGRTHGQPGLPITFGFKAAVWAAEVRRTSSGSSRPSRGSRSASSPARSARSRPGATPAPSCSAG